LQRLEAMLESEPELDEVIVPVRRVTEARRRRYADRVALLSSMEDDDEVPVDDRYLAAVRVRREMIIAEREELLAWRDAGWLPDADLRVLERALDHEEIVLPPAP
jgi:CPA1 family monovalent cation:H+ antiporter